ncbi:hypothetical protein CYMTET_11319 [Cymbomonas tetramitiformis]|uniref:FAS1 domain-containing protein n=1 Tax=Cymbomonas tetramitiformis TaxID=36881 RepID=A0AAE0LDL1_9CHLO|nr:hypothetical protein CYMTET_11319 [Cymbomonas tetramitiformis]
MRIFTIAEAGCGGEAAGAAQSQQRGGTAAGVGGWMGATSTPNAAPNSQFLPTPMPMPHNPFRVGSTAHRGDVADPTVAFAFAGQYASQSTMGMLVRDPAFNLFARAAHITGLDQELDNADALFTVFCPTTHHINALCVRQGRTLLQFLQSPRLKEFVQNHIAVGLMAVKELVDGYHVHVSSGMYHMVRHINGGQCLKIGENVIQGSDMRASNGIVHAIGGLLFDEVFTK